MKNAIIWINNLIFRLTMWFIFASIVYSVLLFCVFIHKSVLGIYKLEREVHQINQKLQENTQKVPQEAM